MFTLIKVIVEHLAEDVQLANDFLVNAERHFLFVEKMLKHR